MAAVFAACVTGVYFYRRLALAKGILDTPNYRSSHTVPTPRGGGIVFVVISVMVIFWVAGTGREAGQTILIVTASAFFASLIGFADDLFRLSSKARFCFQAVVAVIFLTAVGWGLPAGWSSATVTIGKWGYVVMFFAVVWSINLFNFMDGIDGIASVEAVMVLLPGAFFLWMNGGTGFALAVLVVASAVLGFFVWNRPPAKIFMGDAGSYFLGFFIMALAIAGDAVYGVPLEVWMLLYAVFLFDATVTLMRRIVAGEAWYEAHHSHAYQRLVRHGLSHGKVVGLIAAVNTGLVALAVAGFFNRPYLPLLGFIAVTGCAVLYIFVERLSPFRNDLKP